MSIFDGLANDVSDLGDTFRSWYDDPAKMMEYRMRQGNAYATPMRGSKSGQQPSNIFSYDFDTPGTQYDSVVRNDKGNMLSLGLRQPMDTATEPLQQTGDSQSSMGKVPLTMMQHPITINADPANPTMIGNFSSVPYSEVAAKNAQEPVSVRDHTIGDDTFGYIKKKEGFSPTSFIDAYDQYGNPIYSKGYGSRASGNGQWSEDIAHGELTNDLNSVDKHIKSTITQPLSRNQYNALVSFGQNVGAGAINDIAPLINKGNFAEAADKMKDYVHVRNAQGGYDISPGLVTRRGEESSMMMNKSQSSDDFDGAIKDMQRSLAQYKQKRLDYHNQQAQQQPTQPQQANQIDPRAIAALMTMGGMQQGGGYGQGSPYTGSGPMSNLPLMLQAMQMNRQNNGGSRQ
jgi:lysozyme